MSKENEKKKILVCVPAFNEEQTVREIVLVARKYATDVVVCDDGSTDDTARIAKEAGAIVIKYTTNHGYGMAVRTLFDVARAMDVDAMVIMDSDGQHDANSIPLLLDPVLHDGFDIVIGSRFLESTDRRRIPMYRVIGIKTITKLVRTVSYVDITDAQSGFRAYSKNAILSLDLSEKGMAISTEILFSAKGKGLSIKEVPIGVNYDLVKTSTHNPISHGLNLMYHIFLHVSLRRPLLFYGLPGIVMVILSVLLLGKALELFSETRFVSTNLILVSIGLALIGVVLLCTAAIIITLIAALKGRTNW